jgi:hypothetical protein
MKKKKVPQKSPTVSKAERQNKAYDPPQKVLLGELQELTRYDVSIRVP